MRIEKDVPIPAQAECQQKYPFLEMEVGDSFVIEGDQKAVRRVRAAATWHNQGGTGIRFAVRRTSDGFRCWRVE